MSARKRLDLLDLMDESYDGKWEKLSCGHMVDREEIREGVCLLCQWETAVRTELRGRRAGARPKGRR